MRKTIFRILVFTALGILATIWAIGVLNLAKWFFDWIFANDLRYAISMLIGGYISTGLVLAEVKKTFKIVLDK